LTLSNSLVSGHLLKVVPRQRTSHAKRNYQVAGIKIRAKRAHMNYSASASAGSIIYTNQSIAMLRTLPHGTSFEFNELCTTKGEYIDEFHSRIIVTGERSIVLSRTPTKSGGGYSSSPNARYIRCNRTYSCERWY
jgi:hypothetical protein